MTYRDLGEYLARLEQAKQLKVISEPVSGLEITEIAHRLSRRAAAKNPALLFERVEDCAYPVAANLFGTAQRTAWALGVEALDALGDRFTQVLELLLPGAGGGLMSRAGDLLSLARSTSPLTVRRSPVQDQVTTDPIDVRVLPALRWWPHDTAPRLTFAQVIIGDGAAGRSVGQCAAQLLDRQTLGLLWRPHMPGYEAWQRARAAGLTRVPAAVVLGGDPASLWAASAPLPPGMDAYTVAGWLRGRPVELGRCATQPLSVPAQGEVVIEGWIDVQAAQVAGQYTEDNGHYAAYHEAVPMHVTAVTAKTAPVCPALIPGLANETFWMGQAAAHLLLPLIRLIQPEVCALHFPAVGQFRNLALVSIHNRFRGCAQKVMYGLWGLGTMMLVKAIIVVDADVDLHNETEVARTVLRQVDWRRDLTLVDGPLDPLDFSAAAEGYGGKIGVDATRKGDQVLDDAPPPDAAHLDALTDGRWRPLGMGTLAIAPTRLPDGAPAFMEALWDICPRYNLIVLDADAPLDDPVEIARRVLAYVDWRRDLVIDDDPQAGQLGIDATRKSDSRRGWPAPAEMTPDVVALVDRRWKAYGVR